MMQNHIYPYLYFWDILAFVESCKNKQTEIFPLCYKLLLFKDQFQRVKILAICLFSLKIKLSAVTLTLHHFLSNQNKQSNFVYRSRALKSCGSYGNSAFFLQGSQYIISLDFYVLKMTQNTKRLFKSARLQYLIKIGPK